MNRKGQTVSYETLIWILRFVYLIFVIVATSGLILGFIVTKADVGSVESHILLHRLQFSQEGITYYDSYTGRVYPGLVDKSKLTNDNLKAALDAMESEMAARFVMSDFSGKELASAYINKDTYENWQPIALVVGKDCEDKEISGTGRKCPHPESRYVYYSGIPSLLETVVITPND